MHKLYLDSAAEAANWICKMTLVNSTQYIRSFIAVHLLLNAGESAAQINFGYQQHNNNRHGGGSKVGQVGASVCMHCGDVVCECDIASISIITYYVWLCPYPTSSLRKLKCKGN